MTYPPQGFTLVQIDFGPKDAGLALAGCENATQRINDHAVAVIHGWHQVNAIVPGAHSEDRLPLGSSFLVLESRSPGWREKDLRPAEGKDFSGFREEVIVADLNGNGAEVGLKNRVFGAGLDSFLPLLAGQVNLAIFPGEFTLAVQQHRGVEQMVAIAFHQTRHDPQPVSLSSFAKALRARTRPGFGHLANFGLGAHREDGFGEANDVEAELAGGIYLFNPEIEVLLGSAIAGTEVNRADLRLPRFGGVGGKQAGLLPQHRSAARPFGFQGYSSAVRSHRSDEHVFEPSFLSGHARTAHQQAGRMHGATVFEPFHSHEHGGVGRVHTGQLALRGDGVCLLYTSPSP